MSKLSSPHLEGCKLIGARACRRAIKQQLGDASKSMYAICSTMMFNVDRKGECVHCLLPAS